MKRIMFLIVFLVAFLSTNTLGKADAKQNITLKATNVKLIQTLQLLTRISVEDDKNLFFRNNFTIYTVDKGLLKSKLFKMNPIFYIGDFINNPYDHHIDKMRVNGDFLYVLVEGDLSSKNSDYYFYKIDIVNKKTSLIYKNKIITNFRDHGIIDFKIIKGKIYFYYKYEGKNNIKYVFKELDIKNLKSKDLDAKAFKKIFFELISNDVAVYNDQNSISLEDLKNENQTYLFSSEYCYLYDKKLYSILSSDFENQSCQFIKYNLNDKKEEKIFKEEKEMIFMEPKLFQVGNDIIYIDNDIKYLKYNVISQKKSAIIRMNYSKNSKDIYITKEGIVLDLYNRGIIGVIK